jgi:ABC-type nitrate/sulfonate/bicarbonate transport system permease component
LRGDDPGRYGISASRSAVATAAVRVSAFSLVIALRTCDVKLVGLANLAKKKPAHLLLTLRLPQTAPNSLQGQRSGLTYTFTAAQAAAKGR